MKMEKYLNLLYKVSNFKEDIDNTLIKSIEEDKSFTIPAFYAHFAIRALESAMGNKIKQLVEEFLHKLSPREERIIRFRTGVGDISILTLEQIGMQFNISLQEVHQIEHSALLKLSTYLKRYIIRTLL